MLRALPILLYLGLTIYAVTDLVQRPEKDPYGVPRWAWFLIVILIPFLGAIGWIVMSRFYPEGGAEPRRSPTAPDDDPEYLSWLREQGKRRKKS